VLPDEHGLLKKKRINVHAMERQQLWGGKPLKAVESGSTR
jgi:hypothetical protein